MARLAAIEIAVASFLLFLVQPMVAKMALPLFGGSPLVWATCLLFFQTVLLLGYLWAHFVARRSWRWHAALLVATIAFLPPVITAASAPEPGAWPVPALLLALAFATAAPFLALSANATLVQHWVARATGREPFRLYAVSNAASLVALLSYPVLVEPFVGLSAQARVFSAAYVAFVLLALAVAFATRAPGAVERAEPPSPLDRWTVAGWIVRATAGSMLVVAVSVHATTDIAAAPFLWVVPLAIYLFTFVLAFGLRRPPGALAGHAVLLAAGILLLPLAFEVAPKWQVSLALDFTGLFAIGWVIHADLAARRPPADRLTAFYLCLALGGALGGLFGSLVAPMLFDSIAEYPLALFLATVVIAVRGPRAPWTPARASVAVVLVGCIVASFAGRLDGTDAGSRIAIAASIAVLALGHAARIPVFAHALLALLVLTGVPSSGRLLERERSFFGLVRVYEIAGWRRMIHGTIIHGSQQVDPPNGVPTTYYHPTSPMARLVAAQPAGARIGVVGLGAGSLAASAPEGTEIVFFEIDPTIEPIARRWFTYLDDAVAKVSVVVGDARLTLAREEDASFDLLVIDAFSSDAIPVHLLTVEAIDLYARKTRGAIALHLSNRFLVLEPVVSGAAAEVGLTGRSIHHEPDEEATAHDAYASHVAILARDAALLDALAPDWAAIEAPVRPWTDDRSSVATALSFD